MSLYNSLITKLRASSLIVNVQSCLRGRRVYGWEVRSGKMWLWCRTRWEFVSTAQKSSSSVSSTRCDTEGSTALYRLGLSAWLLDAGMLQSVACQPKWRNPTMRVKHKVACWAPLTFSASLLIPWLRRILRGCIDWAHLLTTPWMCSLTDKRLEIVTPSILTSDVVWDRQS